MTGPTEFNTAQEIEIKPKIGCPECREFFQQHKLSAHIERHRPVMPSRPGTKLCPKGCPRHLTTFELKEHVPFCDGSLPLPSMKGSEASPSAAPKREPPPVLPMPPTPPPMVSVRKLEKNKEKPVAKPPKRECPVCHEMVAGGKGFGGHMSKHGKARDRKAAEKAARTPKPAAKRRGKKIAPSTASRPAPRAGGILPPPPARQVSGNVVGSLPIALRLRQAASQKRREADELEKMAQRAEELL